MGTEASHDPHQRPPSTSTVAVTRGRSEKPSPAAAATAAAQSGGPSSAAPASAESSAAHPTFTLDEIASAEYPALKCARGRLRQETRDRGRHEQFQRMRAVAAEAPVEPLPTAERPTRVQFSAPPTAPVRTQRRKRQSHIAVAPASASAWEQRPETPAPPPPPPPSAADISDAALGQLLDELRGGFDEDHEAILRRLYQRLAEALLPGAPPTTLSSHVVQLGVGASDLDEEAWLFNRGSRDDQLQRLRRALSEASARVAATAAAPPPPPEATTDAATRPNVQVVAGVLQRPPRVLIAKGKHGMWEFPGGKVESGETNAAALRRELKEELNILCARNFRPICSHEGERFTVHVSEVLQWTGEPEGAEGQSIRWATPSEVANLTCTPSTHAALAQLMPSQAGAELPAAM